MKIATIHQIEHLVWLGLVDKISKADVFVLADNFQFKKNYYENRNKIRTKDGWQWLTVPVEKDNHKPINEVKIINDIKWQLKYLNTIKQNYQKSEKFNFYYLDIENIILGNWSSIGYLNERLLKLFLNWFNIKTSIIRSSELNLQHLNEGTITLLEICQKVGADTYLSGSSGKNYLNLDLFEKNNIKVVFHEFIHPIYKQQYEPFIPNMSAIDYLFNCGGKID